MNIKGVFKGTVLELIIMLLFLLLSAVLVYFNIISTRVASIIVFAGAVIGVFVSSFGIARTSETKILVNAMSVGVLFCIILLICSAIINGELSFHTRTLFLIGSSLASSFIAALFGK